jgi:hypothetical protein
MLTTTLPFPMDDTPALIAPALRLFDAIWKPGLGFQKCGVMLTNLMVADRTKRDLFETRDPDRERRLMRAVDALNRDYGARTIDIGYLGAGEAQIVAPGQLYERPLYDLMVRVADCPLIPGSPLIREEKDLMSGIYFEIQAEDVNRAADFYTRVFGWKFSEVKGLPIAYCH